MFSRKIRNKKKCRKYLFPKKSTFMPNFSSNEQHREILDREKAVVFTPPDIFNVHKISSDE